jgi:hypothetical protein
VQPLHVLPLQWCVMSFRSLLSASFLCRSAHACSPGLDFADAPPFRTNAVLIVNPVTNTADTTTMSGFGTTVFKWYSIAWVPDTLKLCMTPPHATSLPFRAAARTGDCISKCTVF